MIPESELVLNDDGSVYHLHLKNEHIADTVILVGDQGRVKVVSSFFDKIEFQFQNREFNTHTGIYKGKRITVLSTGIGTDNIDIVINELDAAVNIDPVTRTPNATKRSLQLIRIGTSGGLHESVPTGSFLVSEFGLGLDGLIHYYKYEPSEEEAILNEKINAHLQWNPKLSEPYLIKGDEILINYLGENMLKGITVTASGFYGPQGRKITLLHSDPMLNERLQSFNHENHCITNFEMETSALYGLGKMLGHRCCTCCVIIANRVTKKYSENYKMLVRELIQEVLDKISAVD